VSDTMERVGSNGERLTYLESLGIWVDGAGERGYKTYYTGAYVCYSCGHLCECGWEDQE
jgi:hypothetical protein